MPTPGERVYTSLLLLTLALRPLPDGIAPDLIQLDRAGLWRIAEAAGAPVGRNTFYAVLGELAGQVPDAAELLHRRDNGWTVTLFRVAADPDTWADEVLEPLGFADVPAALAAASALGIDTTAELPADVLLPAPAAEDEDEPDELAVKVCTRCREEHLAEDFPERASGRLSSWCVPCTRAATRAWRERRRPAGALSLPAPADRQTSATARTNGDKVCPGCRRRKPLGHFHRDASRGDGHSVRCKACRSEAAHDTALRLFTDY